MRALSNIFWLGLKEIRALFKERVLVVFIVYSLTFAVYMDANAMGEEVNNAAVAIVDEDASPLSRRIADLLYPPYFQRAEPLAPHLVDQALDDGRFTFVLEIPPGFERDLLRGRAPEILLNADATAVMQAALGSGYIQSIVTDEVARRLDRVSDAPGEMVVRRAFNPSGNQSWFGAVTSLTDQLSVLIIVLTGAALLREREHGTLEHLMVMPLRAVEIGLAKVWSNGLVILTAFALSLHFVVEDALDVPIAGSKALLLTGAALQVFATAAIGIFLGTIARTMAQFALLMLMTIMPMMMLSGGMTPIESQPDWLQPITWFLPSRHFIAFMQGVAYRGADLSVVWPELVTLFAMGMVFLWAAIAMFRRSLPR